MNRSAVLLCLLIVLPLLGACAGQEKEPVATIANLDLDRVVLYRNGVGYFERTGTVKGDFLTLKCRKDQINDVLKSLTVVDKNTGRALSVSMPLDPQSWANAALATLSPGEGNLAGMLDTLRGTWVTISDGTRNLKGRIMMVEIFEEYDDDDSASIDHRITLLDGNNVRTILASDIQTISFEDEELALQLHRTLDASAGEGMFQQVEVDVRLAGEDVHDLLLSYVVSAPIWKPTYRVVLPAEPNGEALLQGWAVVDNTSGEDWAQVDLSLTSGAPIAFQYNLHTPLNIHRPDMTRSGTKRRARVSMGETTIDLDSKDFALNQPVPEGDMAKPRRARKKAPAKGFGGLGVTGTGRGGGGMGGARSGLADLGDRFGDDDLDETEENSPMDSGVLFDELQNSTRASARAKRVSGLTQFNLQDRVTVPDGSSTMVAIINETVDAEQTFLFRPGGAGPGYEINPYRVVRFKNSTPFALEPGPISVYAGGSFVGEGISEMIATKTSATIPFAVEPEIQVTSSNKHSNSKSRLIRIGRGYLRIETFQRQSTTWTVKAPSKKQPYRVLIRHSQYGKYKLKERPEGTEDLPRAYLVPIEMAAGETEASITIIEQTPTQRSVSIWDGAAPQVLDALLTVDNLDETARKKIEPIVMKRREIADIDRRVQNLKKQQRELDHRANETRSNLRAIEKDNRAGALRQRLTKRLEEFTRGGDKLGREVVELTSRRLEKKIELDEALDGFTFDAPKVTEDKKAKDDKKKK